MVVRNLHFMGSIRLPDKADAVLIIYSDAVLAHSISLERLQPVSRRYPQVNQVDARFNLVELTESDLLDRRPALIRATFEELIRVGVPEALNHNYSI